MGNLMVQFREAPFHRFFEVLFLLISEVQLNHNSSDTFLFYFFGVYIHFGACEWASTNHSHLSIPREISVNRSAVSASSNSPASLIVLRASRPNVASARATASTCA